ncbi:MAG TPA: hypothetical protein VF669_13145 [Tepidisphaeraceae bacterium]|jgi:hypothetical protein
MPEIILEGTTPAERGSRQLVIRTADASGEGDVVSLWIRPPGGAASAGWEIRLDRAELLAALRQLHIIR